MTSAHDPVGLSGNTKGCHQPRIAALSVDQQLAAPRRPGCVRPLPWEEPIPRRDALYLVVSATAQPNGLLAAD